MINLITHTDILKSIDNEIDNILTFRVSEEPIDKIFIYMSSNIFKTFNTHDITRITYKTKQNINAVIYVVPEMEDNTYDIGQIL